MHIDYAEKNTSQSTNPKVLKYQFDTLDCTLEELAVLELVAKKPTIKQQKLIKETRKSIATIKRIIKFLQNKKLYPHRKRKKIW